MKRGEQSMVPEPEFQSYYGRPILKEPTWKTPDVPIYLWIGGIAGGSSLLAEGAALSGRPGLERVTRLTAATGAAIGTVAVVYSNIMAMTRMGKVRCICSCSAAIFLVS